MSSHLGTSAEADDVKVREHPEEQLPGQPPVDEGLIMLGEHPGDLPLGDTHVDRVAIPIPENRDVPSIHMFLLSTHLEMIFSLFRCFLPLPLISIPFEYLTMVGAGRQITILKSNTVMIHNNDSLHLKQIPPVDISVTLDDGLHLFVKLLLFLFLGISITAHSYIIH